MYNKPKQHAVKSISKEILHRGEVALRIHKKKSTDKANEKN